MALFPRFAARTADDNSIIDWLFDRKTVLRSFASDKEFCEQYYAMTDFIWPARWKYQVSFRFFENTQFPDSRTQNDLPKHCSSLEPHMKTLITEVSGFRERARERGIEHRYLVDDTKFADEQKTLMGRFCAIFHACVQVDENANSAGKFNETECRNYYDRLLFDFFLRPLDPWGSNCSVCPR